MTILVDTQLIYPQSPPGIGISQVLESGMKGFSNGKVEAVAGNSVGLFGTAPDIAECFKLRTLWTGDDVHLTLNRGPLLAGCQ